MGSVRRWQRLRRHALDLAPAIRIDDFPDEAQFDADAAAVRFGRSERLRQDLSQEAGIRAGVFHGESS